MKTPVPFSFDFHGINDANGQRICKVSSCEPYTYETGQPVRNSEFDELSNLFASAPELLTACKKMLESWGAGQLIEPQDANAARAAIAKAEGK